MIRSMTAFARQETETEQGGLSWEIRSVNHRYLETAVRLPEELRAAEPAVRERVTARLGRGKVDCTCRYRAPVSGSSPVQLDDDNLSRLLAACETVAGRLPQPAPLNPVELLRWPGVVREEELDTAPLQAHALALLDRTLDELVESRQREGGQIRGLLLARCDAMAELVATARRRLPEINSAVREKLRARLNGLEVPADPGRLEQFLDGLITNRERYNKVIAIWSEATEKVSEAMFREMTRQEEERREFNPILMMADSGARGSGREASRAPSAASSSSPSSCVSSLLTATRPGIVNTSPSCTGAPWPRLPSCSRTLATASVMGISTWY